MHGWRAAFLPPHPPTGISAAAAGPAVAAAAAGGGECFGPGDGGEAAAHARFDAMDTQVSE